MKKPTASWVECNRDIPVKNNDSLNYCNDCTGPLCKGWNINHNKNNPTHFPNKVNTILVNPETLISFLLICNLCSNSLDNNLPYQLCSDCKQDFCMS